MKEEEKQYEVAIEIREPRTYDRLVLALVKNGFEVYEGIQSRKGDFPRICFNATNEEVHEIRSPQK